MKTHISRHNPLLKFFPPPKYLAMPSVGLDISDDAVRYVEFVDRSGHFELGVYGEEKLSADIVEDGFIKDKKALAEVLTKIRKEKKLHFITASLPEEKSYLFKIEIPVIPESEIRDALQWKIEENVPIALADAVYDFSIIRKPTQGQENMLVGVTVLHRQVVSSYLDVFSSAGLVPVELEIESQAVARALVPKKYPDTFIIVSLRKTKTMLAIVSRNQVQFTSSLPIGGESIMSSITKDLDVSEEEKNKLQEGVGVRDSNKMFLSLVNASSTLRDEIQKLVSYWDTHGHEHGESSAIKKILIAGSDAMLGLDAYLGRSLNIPAVIVDPWRNIASLDEYLPPLPLREALDYVTAFGLALPYD